LAIIVFWDDKRKQRKEREFNTYHSIDEKYIQYLELCVSNPELDLYYLPLETKVKLNAQQKIKQYALFEILVSLMERAYFMYSDGSSDIKKNQWAGWDNYIQVWCKREVFLRIWKLVGKDFDEKFYAYINAKIKNKDSHATR
jgi:hypothetical protein